MSAFLWYLVFTIFTYSHHVSTAPSKAAGGFTDITWDTEVYNEILTIEWNNTYLQTYKAPIFLNGTLYRNGPGIWRYGKDASNPHWFNGLALLHSFQFYPNSDPKQFIVSYSCKFINSSVYNLYNPNTN